MNFDGKTAIKTTSLRGPSVLAPGAAEESEYISPSGYRNALFTIATNINSTRVLTGKLEHTDNPADPPEGITGTEFTMSVANGDGAAAVRTILISHEAVKEFVRVSVTQAGGANVAPVVGVVQFNAKNSSTTNTVSAVKG